MAIEVPTNKTMNEEGGEKTTKPRLLHDSLHEIPQSFRFPIAGILSNVLFIAAFNACVEKFESDALPAGTIYSILYCLFIPVGHALSSLIVFGWPSPYLPNLLSNAPIGLTAMAIGTYFTGYFEKIQLEATIDQFLLGVGIVSQPEPDEEGSEFYCSLIVMGITAVWSFLLSVYVNGSDSSSSSTSKKEKEL